MEDNANTKTIIYIIEMAFKAAQNSLESAKYDLIRRVREQQEEEDDE